MKLLIQLLLLIFSQYILAGEVYDGIQIIKDQNKNIILKTTCSMIPAATKNLNNLGPIIKNGDACEVNLNHALPEMMIQLHDTFANHSGPNCWNTSLYMDQVLEYRRTVLPEEMDFLTSSEICRMLPLDEKLQFGDLIAIHTHGDPAEFHGFTYINDLISFSKDGFDKQWDYEIKSSNFVFGEFALGLDIAKQSCRHVYGVPSEDACPVYAQIFRCQTRANYLANAEFPSKIDFLGFDDYVRYIEKNISESTVDSAVWNSLKSTDLKNRIEQAKKIADSWLLKIEHLNNAEFFFWQSSRIKLDSLLVQIDFLDNND